VTIFRPAHPARLGLVTYLADPLAPTVLGQRFDLVGFDPRGVGTSKPDPARIEAYLTELTLPSEGTRCAAPPDSVAH
jgi:pimeloyl-ACP methyl ester carboxylesterase